MSQYSVREFIEHAAGHFGHCNRVARARRKRGVDAHTGKRVVAMDPRYFRPTEVETLLGDPTKAKEKLGWTPKISFKQLVEEMVQADLQAAERDALCDREGFRVFDHYE